MKRVEQFLRILQIARVEAFGEPPINRSKQFASFLRLPLITPEAREAYCGAEFSGFCLLLARDLKGALEVRLRF
jgi:hypothetical protein